jgi:type II secretory pathway pseudopilin PulG
MGNERAKDGFTVLEALLALAILGGSLTAILMALSNHRGWQARSENRLNLTMAAEALLQRVGLDIPLKDGRMSGESAGLRWIVVVRSHETRAERSREPKLYGVRVTVGSQASSDRVVLTTLRYGSR